MSRLQEKKVAHDTGSELLRRTRNQRPTLFSCQLIHQGTRLIPCDFIAFSRAAQPAGLHHSRYADCQCLRTN